MRFYSAFRGGPPKALPADEPIDLVHQIDDGYLVALSALRMSVKNGVILTTIRDGVAWDEGDATRLARESVDALALELATTARRLADDSVRAAPKAAATHSAQPRSRSARARAERQRAESARLAARSRTARGVADLLTATRDDDDAMRRLALRARDDTLSELMQARLIPGPARVALTEEEQRAAIEGVIADLDDLMRAVALTRVDG
jgi:hypothetical protein